jgi:hypothetical protein
MPIVPGPLVTAPEPGRRRYGLFTAASGPLDLPSPGGDGGGVRYQPDVCERAYAYPVACYPAPGPPSLPEKPQDPMEDEVVTGVFMALATLACNAVGYTEAELQTRVRRRLLAGEQGAVEAAFWSGWGLFNTSLDILNLAATADAVAVGDPLDLAHVVSALEEYAYHDQGYGYTAMIHAPVGVAAHAHEANLIVYDGPLMRTPFGSTWVFGGGYSGLDELGNPAPDGGTYIHITGQTTVWRGTEENVVSAFHPESNTRYLVAERPYAVGYECLNGRAAFDPLGGV